MDSLIAVLVQARVVPEEDSEVRLHAAKALGGLGRSVEPRELWAAGLGETCDVCNGSISGEGSHLVPYAELRDAVIIGYDPFARGRATSSQALAEAVARATARRIRGLEEKTVLAKPEARLFDYRRDLAAFLSIER